MTNIKTVSLFILLFCVSTTFAQETPRPNRLPELFEDLKDSGDRNRSTIALWSLLRIRIDQSWDIDALLSALDHDKAYVRKIAATVLGRVPQPSRIPALRALSKRLGNETDFITQTMIIESLQQLDRFSAERAANDIRKRFDAEIIEHLDRIVENRQAQEHRDTAAHICESAASAFFQLNDIPNGVRAWLMSDRIKAKTDTEIDTSILPEGSRAELARIVVVGTGGQCYAVQALGQLAFGTEETDTTLLKYINDPPAPLEPAAGQTRIENALRKIEYPCTSDNLRLLAIDALSRTAVDHKRAIKVLRSILDTEQEDHRVRAACGLTRLGDTSGLKLLADQLEGNKPRNTVVLLGCVGHLGSAAATEALDEVLRLTGSKEKSVQAAAQICLARIAGDRSEAVFEFFDKADSKRQQAICHAIWQMAQPSDEFTSGLLERFDRVSEQSRAYIALVLCRLGKLPEAESLKLVELSEHDDRMVRQMSMYALSEHSSLSHAVLARAVEQLRNNDQTVAQFAGNTLRKYPDLPKQIRNKLLEACKSAKPEELKHLTCAVRSLKGDQATPIILKFLRNKDQSVRINAIVNLRNQAQPSEQLCKEVQLLASSDPEPQVRLQAGRFLLSKVRYRAVGERQIKHLLDDPPMNLLSIIWAVSGNKHTPDALVQRLRFFLKDPDPRVQIGAAQSLLAVDPTDYKSKAIIRTGFRAALGSDRKAALHAASVLDPNDIRLRRQVMIQCESTDVQRAAWSLLRKLLAK